MSHIEAISREQHPVGTHGHSNVFAYLVAEIQSLGFKPIIQETTAYAKENRTAGAIRNILVRLPGTNSSKSVLLSAHYDSAPNSLGAADNGAAVAVLLESMRILGNSPRRNDLLFLFSDGEEVGLLGARAFVEHQWATNIGVVLNFDARGTCGPVLMFETSRANDWIASEFCHWSAAPIGNSLAVEVYRQLPNKTDFTIYEQQRIQGLNFANIGGREHYHTLLDCYSNVARSTVTHQAGYTLSLALHFGQITFSSVSKPRKDAVYFNIFRDVAIHYSTYSASLLTVLATVLFGSIYLLGKQRNEAQLRKILLASVLLLVYAALAYGSGLLLQRCIHAYHSRSFGLATEITDNDGLYAGLFLISILATAVIYYSHLGKILGNTNLILGTALVWVLPSVLANIYCPGASFLFNWPAVLTLFGHLSAELSRRWPKFNALAIGLSGLVIFLLISFLVPLFHQFFLAMGLRMLAGIAALAVLALALVITVILRLGSPQWPSVVTNALILALFLFFTVPHHSSFNSTRPKPVSLFYVLDMDSKQALWGSYDQKVSPSLDHFFEVSVTNLAPTHLPWVKREAFLKGKADAYAIDPPDITVQYCKITNGVLRTEFDISSTRTGSTFVIYFKEAPLIYSVQINEKQISPADHYVQSPQGKLWLLIYRPGLDNRGRLIMESKDSDPLNLQLAEISPGLPLPTPLDNQESGLIPAPFVLSKATVLSKNFQIVKMDSL